MESDPEIIPNPAATVVLVRPGRRGLGFEVLLVRRNSSLVFYGGAWVFPGGRIEPDDAIGGGIAAEPGQHDSLLHAAHRAAVRELFEETGLSVDPHELVHFAQWVTPPGRPRRFDTWYFAASAPQGSVRLDLAEADAHRWITPSDALQERTAGNIELPPPTFVTLTQLALYDSAELACTALRTAPTLRYVPKLCAAHDGAIHLYEGDAGYEARDPNLAGPRHRLLAMRVDWRYERSL